MRLWSLFFILAGFVLSHCVFAHHGSEVMSHAEIRTVQKMLPSSSSNTLAANAAGTGIGTGTVHSPHSQHAQHAQRFTSLASVSSSLVVMVPDVTAGPYPEQISDYPYTTNLLKAAHAGSAGVTKDRLTILDGIPLNLTLYLYNVSGSVASPLIGADVFIWHCDAIGVYSSVNLATASSNKEDTQGQYWARAYYPTDANGAVTFFTIIPGWYNPRAVHIHLRVRLSNPITNTTFIVTTQVFTAQSLTDAVNLLQPYSNNTTPGVTLSTDGVYTGIPSALASELVLNPVGSTTTGYAATFNMGIDSSTIASGEPDANDYYSVNDGSSSTSTGGSAPGGTVPGGTGGAGPSGTPPAASPNSTTATTTTTTTTAATTAAAATATTATATATTTAAIVTTSTAATSSSSSSNSSSTTTMSAAVGKVSSAMSIFIAGLVCAGVSLMLMFIQYNE